MIAFAKIFDAQYEGEAIQVCIHLDTYDPDEYGRSDTTDEFSIVIRARIPTGTYITLQKHFASDEQAEQFLIDFDQDQADYFSQYFTIKG